MPEKTNHNFDEPQLDLMAWKPKTPEPTPRPAGEVEPTPPTLEDIRRYFVDHLHQDGFDDDGQVLRYDPIEWLPYFELHCDILRKQGSPNLYRARELTLALDQLEHSGGHIKYDQPDVNRLLTGWAMAKFRRAPKSDSLEINEAKAERDRVLDPLQIYGRIGKIGLEPVIAIVEDQIAELDKSIGFKFAEKNRDPKHERQKRGEIAALEAERQDFRRAQIFLLKHYFSSGPAH